MKIDSEIKEQSGERGTRSKAEIEQQNEKSAIRFYGIAGIVVLLAGVLVALFSNLVAGINIAALGVIAMGIGEILRYLRKILNK
jgi:hypothetical protein